MSGVTRVKLGSQGFEVSAIGLGCMGMSGGYGPLKPEQADMIKLIHHAVHSGVTHLDTSDVYGPHTNEILIGKALKGLKREEVQLATKFGVKFGENFGNPEIHGEPEYVRACCEASLKRLDVDYIDLFYVHRIDTKVPIEITMGELKKLVEEGKIKYIGLSEAGPDTIRRAHAVHPITAVQLEWSLWTRDAEKEVIPTCRELGIGIVPFAPLGSGFFASGLKLMDSLADNDLRKALKGGRREKVQLATKFGIKSVSPETGLKVSGDPAYAKEACDGSLKRLGVDCIDLYYIHRIDTTIPIELTMGALKELVEEGKVKYIGLSEASPETIRRAHAIHPITAVQLEWSLWTRDAEEQVIPTCRELGIGIVPFSPLGKGFFSCGPNLTKTLAIDDIRRHLPKFQGENLEQNTILFEKVNEMAKKKECTTSQLALAWVLHQGDDVFPIPGTTKIENLKENIGSLSVKLSHQDMVELETIASNVKGNRYPDAIMQSTWKDANTPPLSCWSAK